MDAQSAEHTSQQGDGVQVRWYLSARNRIEAITSYLALAQHTFAEALPQSFGRYEPSERSYDPQQPQAVGLLAEAVGDRVHFEGSGPVVFGSMPGPGPGITSLTLTLRAAPLADRGTRERFRQLFVQLARRTDTLLATAELQRGGLGTGPAEASSEFRRAEPMVYLAPGGRWMGLPPYPVWWSWYGAAYRPLVMDSLGAVAEADGVGLFHALSEAPWDRCQLAGRSAAPDPSLLARPRSLGLDLPLHNPPLEAARIMPPSPRDG